MKTNKEAPEPLEDLNEEWAEEDVESERRAPDLGELDEDPSENT